MWIHLPSTYRYMSPNIKTLHLISASLCQSHLIIVDCEPSTFMLMLLSFQRLYSTLPPALLESIYVVPLLSCLKSQFSYCFTAQPAHINSALWHSGWRAVGKCQCDYYDCNNMLVMHHSAIELKCDFFFLFTYMTFKIKPIKYLHYLISSRAKSIHMIEIIGLKSHVIWWL